MRHGVPLPRAAGGCRSIKHALAAKAWVSFRLGGDGRGDGADAAATAEGAASLRNGS